MKIIAILFGVALTILGVINYTVVGGVGLPIVLGVVAILLGLLQGKWVHNNPLYGTMMMAILALLSSLRGIINLFRLVTGSELTLPLQAIYIQAIIAGLSIVYIILCVTLIPDFWHGWKSFGQFLGDWLARVVLTVFYFTIFVPFGFGVRLFADPLRLKNPGPPFWRSRATGDQKFEDLLRQF